ncbi:hypothetical protein NEIRO03_0838 [Nematocida sp. AWRm78]|nr:hypothetical protein NEIRO02_0748 [Nematocida sp. AWRm79]KAI5183220.1 hypothetical protein NEIRO03_0838 [Nematocida sp. AWRm78]
MDEGSTLKKTYSYILKESIYFRRAVLLKPLTKPGYATAYSQVGLWINIAFLFLSMLCSCSLYKTLAGYTTYNIEDGRSVTIYICLGQLVPVFFVMLLFSGIIYSLLFNFTLVESGYVISYSMSTTLPAILIGKSAQLYFKNYLWPINSLVFVLSGVISSIFIIVNSKKKMKGYFKSWCIFIGCTIMQIAMHISGDSSIFGVLHIWKFSLWP